MDMKNGEVVVPFKDISKKWNVINFSEGKGNWKQDKQGCLVQTAEVGRRKIGTGSILLYNNPIETTVKGIKLDFNPGSTHIAGMVFNYQNKKNYFLYFIDQKWSRYKGFDLYVGEVKNGNFHQVCQEDFNLKPPVSSTLLITEENGNLEFTFNNQKLYTWHNQSLYEDTKIGLFSQRNSDAVYEQISLLYTQLCGTIPNTTSEVDTVLPKQVDMQYLQSINEKQGITKFLTTQEPKSKTLIEFKEVFTVPLDSFYSSLYFNNTVNLPGEVKTDKKTKKVTLDYRPKRWYRDYKEVADQIEFVEKDIIRCKAQLDNIQTKIDNIIHPSGPETDNEQSTEEAQTDEQQENKPEVPNLSDLKDEQIVIRDEYMELTEQLNMLRDGKELILRDIKTSGYTYSFEDIPDPLLEYKIKIIGKLNQPTKYEPIENLGTSDLSDNKYWEKELKRLQGTLLSTGGLSEETKTSFTNKSEELTSFETCPELVRQEDEINREIEKLEKQKAIDPVPNLTTERNLWNSERNALERLMGNHQSMDNLTFKKLLMGWARARFQYNIVSSQVIDRFPIRVYDIYLNYQIIGISYCHRYIESLTVTSDDLNWRNEFFSKGIQVCDHFIQKYDSEINNIKNVRDKEIVTQIESQRETLKRLREEGLINKREEFLNFWNNPETNGTIPTIKKIVYPDADPLAEFMASFEKEDNSLPPKTYFFKFSSEGFYNEEGQSLTDFMNLQNRLSGYNENIVVILPNLEKDGRISDELFQAVVNPIRSYLSLMNTNVPIIRFVETYQIEIVWKGYGLGELSHSVNLFPGETREIAIEKKTKLTKKVAESEKQEISETRNIKTSFEDNVEDTFSLNEKMSTSAKQVDKYGQKDITSQTEKWETSKTKTKSGKAGGSLGGASASGSVSSTSTSNWGKTKNDTLEISQSVESEKATNQSKDSLKKNVHKTINKVATETSTNNKLEISSTKTEEMETSTSEKEIIRVENPNIGRTINYNFFQLQNIYETSTRLVDVKIVVNPNVDIIEGSNMRDIRVYELEEFGKVYPNLDQSDPRSTILAGIISRQVLKNYADFLPGITRGNGAVCVKDDMPVDKNMFEILYLIKDPVDVKELGEALNFLKQIPFIFNEVPFIAPDTIGVNAAAYYVEAEVGRMPATEKYLEDRRDIETDKQKALVNQIKEQTKEKVFFPDLPESVTSLALDGKELRITNQKSVEESEN